MSESEPKKKLWWQFSLRSLLLQMLLVAAFFAGYTAAMRRVWLAEFELEAERLRTQAAEKHAHMAASSAALAAEQSARLQHLLDMRNEAIAERLVEQATVAAPAEGKTEVIPQSIEEAELP